MSSYAISPDRTITSEYIDAKCRELMDDPYFWSAEFRAIERIFRFLYARKIPHTLKFGMETYTMVIEVTADLTIEASHENPATATSLALVLLAEEAGL